MNESKRSKVVQEILEKLTNELVITSCGNVSKETYWCKDRTGNFYNMGAMGTTLGIGIGVALNTTRTVIVLLGDGDTGGHIKHFPFIVKTLEHLGISTIIIEDFKFPKSNSLINGSVSEQETIEEFCKKIRTGKHSQVTKDFMIIARIQSFITGEK